MQSPGHDFYLAVATVIPILLLVSVTKDSTLTFRGESRLGLAGWVGMLCLIIIGEVAALRALAWPPGDGAEGLLTVLGFVCSVMTVLLPFLWKLLGEVQERPSNFMIAAVTISLGVGILAVLIVPAF